MSSISTIFFDLDNTLVDYDGPDLTALTALKEQFFPHLTLAQFRDVWGVSNRKNWALYEAGKLTLEEQRLKRVEEVWQAFGQTVSEIEASNIFQLYMKVFENSFQLFPYAKDVLSALHQQPLPLGLITNGGAEQQRKKLRVLEIESFFQPNLIFISSEVGCSKPEERIFTLAQAAANTNPESILFIGDTPDHDIEPAKKLNWNTLLFDHHGKHAVANKITDLRDILKVAL
jgi:HAD superfamily hydrolase (TIGR01549 family)